MSKQSNKGNEPIEINLNGEKYPYRETMGAMLSFKSETGLDAPASTEDLVKYMYHVVKSNCRRDGKKFELSFQEFADALDGEEFLRVTTELTKLAEDKVPGKNV